MSTLYVSQYLGGLCSTTIELFKNGTFTYESGCEASSHVSYGTWTQNKDTIKFRQVNTKGFKILKISQSSTPHDFLSVKLFDQTGENITQWLTVNQYVAGKGFYHLEIDSSKTIRTDLCRIGGVITIPSLEKLAGDDQRIPIDSFKSFDITLNIPNNLIYNINRHWINIGDFQLIKRKDSLWSSEAYTFDENGKLAKIEYKIHRE